MRRFVWVGLIAALSACSGGAGRSLLPVGSESMKQLQQRQLTPATAPVSVNVRVLVPAVQSASAFSNLTKSFTFAVGTLPLKKFNAVSGSPGCSAVSGGLSCSFAVPAPMASDAFTIQARSALNGGGSTLEKVRAVIPVTTALVTSGITLGQLVSNVNDSGAGSLRQAIASAAAGQTIAFALPIPSTIAVVAASGPYVLNKTLQIYGPGQNLLTITGNDAVELFTVRTNTHAAIAGVSLTHGASPNGGAILNRGYLTIDSSTIAFNHTTIPAPQPALGFVRVNARGAKERPGRLRPHFVYGDGAGIYDGGGTAGSLTVTNSSFNSNATPPTFEGGGIFNQSGYVLSVSRSSFSKNSASWGGGLESDGPATLTQDAFSNNSSPLYASGASYAGGSAVHLDADSTVTGCNFVKNVTGAAGGSDVTGYGGALDSADGSLTVSGSTFTGNTAGGGTSNGSFGEGGAMTYYGSSTFTLTNDTFSQNVASGDHGAKAGAVYSDGNISGSGDAFTSNVASSSAGFAEGGAVYESESMTLSGSTFTSNQAIANGYPGSEGGALWAGFPATLTGDTFAKNQALIATAGLTATGGGAYVSGFNSTLTNVTFTQNVAGGIYAGAQAYGGGLYGNNVITVTNGTFSQNLVESPQGFGGGIYAGGAFTFSGTISGNTATTQGGGIYAHNHTTITNSTISQNSVASPQAGEDGGGGIYNASQLTLSGSTLNGNSVLGNVAGTGGGAIYSLGAATIYNTTIAGNSSSKDGGGIENLSSSNFSLINVTLYQNTAGGAGGNLKNYFQGATSIANTIIAGGNAQVSGPDVSNDWVLTSNDYNILQTPVGGTAMTGTTTHNMTLDPLLLPLANNGGPTQTNAEQANSPGVDAVPLANCTGASPSITADQRGMPRGDQSDGFCDIGAYEMQT